MITYSQYMSGEYSYRDYMGQFVTERNKDIIVRHIGNAEYLYNQYLKDKHLNEGFRLGILIHQGRLVMSSKWDLLPIDSESKSLSLASGNTFTQATKVGILKASAFDIIADYMS